MNQTEKSSTPAPGDSLTTGWLVTIWTIAAIFVAGVSLILFGKFLDGVLAAGAAAIGAVVAFASWIETRPHRKALAARFLWRLPKREKRSGAGSR
jgi:membrane protease YdiL (CAAX protease family)